MSISIPPFLYRWRPNGLNGQSSSLQRQFKRYPKMGQTCLRSSRTSTCRILPSAGSEGTDKVSYLSQVDVFENETELIQFEEPRLGPEGREPSTDRLDETTTVYVNNNLSDICSTAPGVRAAGYSRLPNGGCSVLTPPISSYRKITTNTEIMWTLSRTEELKWLLCPLLVNPSQVSPMFFSICPDFLRRVRNHIGQCNKYIVTWVLVYCT